MTTRWKIAQFFELNWWKQYFRNKPIDDYLNHKTNYWKKVIQQFEISFEGQEDILIVGCGPTGIYMALEEHKVKAIDPLLEEYENKLQHFKRDFYPNIEFHQQTIEAYKDEKTYDKVFCLNVVNHVNDIDLAMNKLAAFVRPNGYFILSIDTHNYPILKRLFRLFPYLDILHPHQYDLEEYKEMMRSRGFTIEKLELLKAKPIFDYNALIARKIS